MTQMFLARWAQPGAPDRMGAALVRELDRLGCRQCDVGGGLSVFVTDDLPIRDIADQSGCVIGHVFDESGHQAPPTIPHRMFAFDSEAIIDNFWGSYVAINVEPGGLRTVRDPSGGLSAYYACDDCELYITSAPHLLIDARAVSVELDWQVIARSLSEHAARGPETALRGITELLPGRALEVRGSETVRRRVWDPWRSAARNADPDPAGALERVLTSTLAAWTRTTQRPLIEVSGGLDSGIVAAGVAAAAPGASLISFAPAPGDPDERIYARALAAHLGLPLEIRTPQIADVDLTQSMSRDLPRPNARAFVQAADRQSLLHARTIGADAFFSGGGGDDVFCYLRTILPAIDRLREDGPMAMLRTCADVARMNHATLWDASLKLALRLFRGHGRRTADRLFLGRAADDHRSADELPPDHHRLPGKIAHVESVLSIHNYLEGHARADFAPIHSPLLSQPIVEFCLAVPTWRWCDGGRNRAVARDAFADRLPRLLLERRSKGSFDGLCAQLFHLRRRLIGDMLTDGILAKRNLIDAEGIGRALENPFPPAETIGRVLAIVDAESWASSWHARLSQRN